MSSERGVRRLPVHRLRTERAAGQHVDVPRLAAAADLPVKASGTGMSVAFPNSFPPLGSRVSLDHPSRPRETGAEPGTSV